jgi:hypothetical protein
MDGTRARRTRDRARQAWYAWHRQWRFARFLGFLNSGGPAPSGCQRRALPSPLAVASGMPRLCRSRSAMGGGRS